MFLTGSQIGKVVDAISHAYQPRHFDQMLLARLDKNRVLYSMGGDYREILYDTIKAANAEGWIDRLVVAARESNPGNPQLAALERELSIGTLVDVSAAGSSLEKIVNDRSAFSNVAAFLERFGRIETWVCAVETPAGSGTGILVAPDIVLTNYHVVEPLIEGMASPAAAWCRFDFKASADGKTIAPGRNVPLAAPWNIAASKYSKADLVVGGSGWTGEELDFALIRLARPIGNASIGENAEPDAPLRGWMVLPSHPAQVVAGEPLFVVQHPLDLATPGRLQPMQMSIGTALRFVGDGLRLRHDARTLPGSSGSLCFDANLAPVALHHSGDPQWQAGHRGTYNQAIPLTPIVAWLARNGHDALLDLESP